MDPVEGTLKLTKRNVKIPDKFTLVTSPPSGILKVTIIQTRDVPFPTASSTPPGGGTLLGPLPYAIVDFDKSQIISRARYQYLGVDEPPIWAGEEESSVHDIRRYTYCFDVTRQAELQIWLYQPAARGDDVNTDVFLGKAVFRPLLTGTSETTREWLSLHNGVGAISIIAQFISTEPLISMVPLEPFEVISGSRKSLSSLSYTVILRYVSPFQVLPLIMAFTDLLSHVRRKKNTNLDYASVVLRKGKHDSLAVRRAASQIDNPFIVPLKFGIEIPGGGKHYLLCAFLHHYDLSEYLESVECLELAEARFYAAQLLSALECLHDLGILCGRLQPSNIYIDFTGYLVLGDFDLYIQDISGNPWLQPPSHDAKTYTPIELDKSDQPNVDRYLAPELRSTQGDSHDIALTADWWSFGVVLHQLLTGRLPSHTANDADIPLSIPIPPNGIPIPRPAEDLLAKLLSRNPLQRLGAHGSEEIKSHPFFDEMDWPKLRRKEYIPGFRPPLVDERALLLKTERPCGEPDLSKFRISRDEEDRLRAIFSGFTTRAQNRAS